MSATKQLILYFLTMFLVINFSQKLYVYYMLYSGFLAGCVYVILFRKMYFVYTNLIGQIKSILLIGWKAVSYGSICLILGISAGIWYQDFNTSIFLQSLTISLPLSFWGYKLVIKFREDKQKKLAPN